MPPPTLGPGPMRFAPGNEERPIRTQIRALSRENRECLSCLKELSNRNLNDELALRFARCSSVGKKKFDLKHAEKALRICKERRLKLNIAEMEQQLLTKTLFPVPGLKAKGKESYDVLYMKPARYFPEDTSTSVIIDNLAYAMNTMLEKEQACTDGIVFMACMDDWKMKNFNVNYCLQFMNMLQGITLPVRVRRFLIVNPPPWFGKIWAIMKPMLTPHFRKTVRMISEKVLYKYLEPGYQMYLPDDMTQGRVPTAALVEDYVTYRKHAENERALERSKSYRSW